jgi:hypothetical protein
MAVSWRGLWPADSFGGDNLVAAGGAGLTWPRSLAKTKGLSWDFKKAKGFD